MGCLFVSRHSKLAMSAALLSEHEAIFRCPICSGSMRLANGKRLLCSNQHSFDIAKPGYVHLLSRASKTKYDKRMFASRRILCQSGFFAPLSAMISDTIIRHGQAKQERMALLDAGCGEGSHLSGIQDALMHATRKQLLAVGVDLSKEGIHSAAKEYSHVVWCVADLANCPFGDHQFDAILNIFSPANYAEFRRMLADDGIVIKVIPGSDYLKELREILYADTKKQAYSNDHTLDLFRAHFARTAVEQVRYRIPLDNRLIGHLLHMSPLAWGATDTQRQRAAEMNQMTITVDATVLVGHR